MAFPRRDRKKGSASLSKKESDGKCSHQGPVMGDLMCHVKGYSS